MSDLSHWLSEPETARRLGISERQLRTRASQGKLPERMYRPRPAGKAQPVYNPRDVEDLEAAKPMVLPPDGPARTDAPVGRSPARAGTPMAANPFLEFGRILNPFLERITTALERRLEPPKALEPPPTPTPWVTMAQAAQITGLSENLLRNLVRTGRLPFFRDKQGWKVAIADLEHLEASKLRQVTEEVRTAVAGRRNR